MTEYFPSVPEFMESISDWNRTYGSPLYELALVAWYILAILTNLRILTVTHRRHVRSHEPLLDTIKAWVPFGCLQVILSGGIYFLARWDIVLALYILGYLIVGIGLIAQAREENRSTPPK